MNDASVDDSLRDLVRSRVAGVHGPDGVALGDGGRLSEIIVRGGRVHFFIAITLDEAVAWEPVRAAVEKAASGVPGVTAPSVP